MQPPIAKAIPHTLEKHGDTRIDPYFWLREKENQEVLNYLEEENAYTQAQTAHLKETQEQLFEEIKGRIKEIDSTVPYKKGDYYYYSRTEKGAAYRIHCRKKENLEAEEEILLDVNKMAKGHVFYRIVQQKISYQQNILAYSVDLTGGRRNTIYFKNLETGELLEDIIPEASYFDWASDNQTIFYSTYDDAMRADKIFRHQLGTPISEDVMVLQESDEVFDLYPFTSQSKDYVILGSYSKTATEIRYVDAHHPTTAPQLVTARQAKHEYHVYHYGDKFYILTNDQAQNFRLMVTDISTPDKAHWKEFVPHREDTLLDEIKIFDDYLVLVERAKGLAQLHVKAKAWDGTEDYYLPFNDPTYVVELDGNHNFNAPFVRYAYQSLTTPFSVCDFNMATKETVVLKQQEVLGDFDANNYRSERLFATAPDGVKVPISLVYRKDLKKDGTTNPCYLYGYGAYGYNIEPGFSTVRLSLLDRGFVFAIAHIRGSQTMGRAWYEKGKFLHKKNTFNDFNACAEYLIQEQYTQAEKLVICGGSAGGLLMGACMNLRPDLFKAVIAYVPFVDVITTMLDTSIPLTTSEYQEWGNPNDKVYYDYMKSYSPYDNVEKKDYPNLLVISGLHDTQVHYWEPAKWVAKLRAYKTDQNPLLFKINMEVGHGGASGRYERYKEYAFEYAVVLEWMK